MEALKIGTELCIGNADEVMRLLSAFRDGGPDFLLDLGEVERCDTAGLQLICSLRKTLAQRAERLLITRLSRAVEAAAAGIGITLREVSGLGTIELDTASGTGSAGAI